MIFLSAYILFLCMYGCVGSSFLHKGPLQLRQAGATPYRGARAPRHRGPPPPPRHCGAQAPDAQAQQLWLTGRAAPRHAGSSQTRARTRVPRTGRQTPNHCATREALGLFLIENYTVKILPPSIHHPLSWPWCVLFSWIFFVIVLHMYMYINNIYSHLCVLNFT